MISAIRFYLTNKYTNYLPKNKGCAHCVAFIFRYEKAELGLADGFVGAGAFAGAAIDAFIGIDGVGGVAGYDSAHRAHIGAGTACYAKIGIDFSRHGNYL